MVLWVYYYNHCIIACFVRVRQNYKDVGFVIFSSIRGVRASIRFQMIYVNTQKCTEHFGGLRYNDFQTTIVYVVRWIKMDGTGNHALAEFTYIGKSRTCASSYDTLSSFGADHIPLHAPGDHSSLTLIHNVTLWLPASYQYRNITWTCLYHWTPKLRCDEFSLNYCFIVVTIQ